MLESYPILSNTPNIFLKGSLDMPSIRYLRSTKLSLELSKGRPAKSHLIMAVRSVWIRHYGEANILWYLFPNSERLAPETLKKLKKLSREPCKQYRKTEKLLLKALGKVMKDSLPKRSWRR